MSSGERVGDEVRVLRPDPVMPQGLWGNFWLFLGDGCRRRVLSRGTALQEGADVTSFLVESSGERPGLGPRLVEILGRGDPAGAQDP